MEIEENRKLIDDMHKEYELQTNDKKNPKPTVVLRFILISLWAKLLILEILLRNISEGNKLSL